MKTRETSAIENADRKNMLRLWHQDDFFELNLITLVPADENNSQSDVYFNVRVSSGGFCGQNQVCVTGESFKHFCGALLELERHRRGAAALESMSPQELNMSVRIINSRGHVAIEGSIGRHIHRESLLVWHAVHFGFEFDPSQLLEAVNLEWVKSNDHKK